MKYLLSPLTAALFFALVINSAAGDPAQPHKITVIGTAIIKVVPDEMQWCVQVSINDTTLAKAKARHDVALDAALKYLQSLGESVKDLQTGGVRFDRDYYPGTDSFLRKNPYCCATEFTFTLVDFDKYGPLTDALSKLEGTQIESVAYASSKEAVTRRDALKRAVLDAKSKADDIAEAASCQIDKPFSIDEAQDWGVRPDMMNTLTTGTTMAAADSRGTPSAVAGQIEISARVVASYELLPPK